MPEDGLLDLKVRGILLAVCAKNNPEDARLPSKNTRVWDCKASNLRRIAQKLSLPMDSFVFLDDNPLERAWVRSQLPEVAVVEPGPSIHTYVHQLDRGRYFYTLTLPEKTPTANIADGLQFYRGCFRGCSSRSGRIGF